MLPVLYFIVLCFPDNYIGYNNQTAEVLKWTCPPFIIGTVHYPFWGYQDKNLILVSQQYRV